MPRVTFVSEHRVVDAEAGKSLREVARAAGVELGHVCWVDGAVSDRTWSERLRGMRGWRRSPDRACVLGDVKVYSAPGGPDRVGGARAIAPAPSPATDPSASRKPIDAASTAEHVRGHPSAVGRGEPPKAPAPPESRPNAARPLTTIPPPPQKE